MAIRGADGSIILNTKIDNSGINKGMSSITSGAKSLIGVLGKLATAVGVAFSVKTLISFSKQASQTATKTEANIQRLIDIYGSASQAVGDFIDLNAQALGMSKSAAAGFSAVYGNLFSVWADQVTNARLTTEYLNMTAVVASKTGRTMEDVQERIRSGLLGNTEAVEDLGVFVNVKTIEMTEAFQRMANGRSWEKLNAYEQSQVRALAILEQATNKYGNTVARNSALTRAQYNAAYEDFKNTWGTIVNYVLMPVLKALTMVFNIATAVLQAIFRISGKTINVDTSALEQQEQYIGGAVDNQNNLTEAVKGTNKELKKSIAGFDDLQILTEKSSSGETDSGLPTVGGNAGGLGTTGVSFDVKNDSTETSLLQTRMQELKRALSGLDDIDTSKLTESLELLSDPIDKLGQVEWAHLLWGIENVFVPLSEFTIEDVLPRFFESLSIALGVYADVLDNNYELFEQFYEQILRPIAEYTADGYLEIWDEINEKLSELGRIVSESTVWQDLLFIMEKLWPILEPCVKLMIAFEIALRKIGYNIVLDEIATAFLNIEDAIGLVADIIRLDFDGAWERLNDLLVNNKLKLTQSEIETVKTKFGELNQTVFGFVGDWKTNTDEMFEHWKTKIGKWWEEDVAPWFSLETWGALFATIVESCLNFFVSQDGFVQTWNTNMEKWWEDNVLKWLKKETWEGIWDNIVSSTDDFFHSEDGFVQTWKTNIETWWNEDVLSWLSAEKWKEIGKNIKDGVSEGLNGAIGAIAGTVNEMIDGFQKAINGATGLINDFIKGWNTVADVSPLLPSITQIKALDLSKYKIPGYARGTVVPPNKPFLGVLGDNKNETEVVSPVSTLKTAFKEALLEMGGGYGGNTEVILEIDGREFGRAVVEQGNRENRRIGTRLVIA